MNERMKFPVSPRPLSRLVVVCVTCLAEAMPFVASKSLAQGPFLEFSASAYGTNAFVTGAGATVISGPTAPVSIGGGCGTPKVGAMADGVVFGVSVPPIIVALTGTTADAIHTHAESTSDSAFATSDVLDINLLGGLITGTEVEAVSTTSQDSMGVLHVSGDGSKLVNLVVNGTAITAVPAPNTTIQLPGIGRVVLNEQIQHVSSTNAGLTVNMIHVFVTTQVVIGGQTIKAGTQIIVSHAVSGLTVIGGPASLDGTAFGTSVSSAIIRSSPTAPASVGCDGNPKVTNTLVGVTVNGAPIDPSLVVLNSGTITDTAEGSVTASLSSAETTSTIQSVNLLNGTITASVITDQADASTTDGMTFNFSQSGSIATLSVSGHPEITANSTGKFTLAGIGTLYLHRVAQTSNSITVRMIEVVLASGNIFGLPTGMDIIVCSSSASLHSPAHP